MKFPKEIWLEKFNDEVNEAMKEPIYPATEDPERTLQCILARIEYAERWTDRYAVSLLLEVNGLELV